MSTFATILLAAGDSTRMGHDKALLPFGDQNVVEALSTRALDAGTSFVRICIAAHLEPRLTCRAPHTRILVVPEDQRARGPIGSIRHGLTTTLDARERALGGNVDAWLLWPVDHPFVRIETLRALATNPGSLRAPVHASRRGHPILIDESERGHLMVATSADGTTLRDFMRDRRYGVQVQEVPVDDEAIHWNCDDRERFLRGYELFVSP